MEHFTERTEKKVEASGSTFDSSLFNDPLGIDFYTDTAKQFLPEVEFFDSQASASGAAGQRQADSEPTQAEGRSGKTPGSTRDSYESHGETGSARRPEPGQDATGTATGAARRELKLVPDAPTPAPEAPDMRRPEPAPAPKTDMPPTPKPDIQPAPRPTTPNFYYA